MKKSHRKDVIIARIIFAFICLILIGLIVFGVKAIIKYKEAHPSVPQTEILVDTEEDTDAEEDTITQQPVEDENDQWLVEEETEPEEPEIEEEVTEDVIEEEPVEEEPEEAGPIVLQAMYGVNIRAGAGKSYEVISSVLEGEKVILLEEGTDGWGQIQYGDVIGYVYLEYFLIVEQPSEARAQDNRMVVVLDPGHQVEGDNVAEPNGPNSATMKARCTSGTRGVSTGVYEYQLALDISLALQKELEGRGYTVYLTRTTNDVNMSNIERAQYATSVGGDITVRIHANGADDSSISGAVALTPSEENEYVNNLADSSNKLANSILDKYCEATGFYKRGIITSDVMTGINWSTMPVTILELGFMTNESDDVNMQDAVIREKMVKGIADGIDDYFF